MCVMFTQYIIKIDQLISRVAYIILTSVVQSGDECTNTRRSLTGFLRNPKNTHVNVQCFKVKFGVRGGHDTKQSAHSLALESV
jgi:hypothetical protein